MEGRAAEPTAAVIGSQALRAADTVGAGSRAWDGGRKVGGRKGHLAVDCLGLLLAVAVTAASVRPGPRRRDAAMPVLCCNGSAGSVARSLWCGPVALVWADGAYAGRLVDWAANNPPFGDSRSPPLGNKYSTRGQLACDDATMTQIIKGGNLPMSGEPMRIAVVRRAAGPGVPEIDPAALLLDDSGKVRGRSDLIFYNQRSHTTSAVQLLGNAQGDDGRTADWLEIDPGQVEPEVERIVIAASAEGGTFGDVPGLYVEAVSAVTGERMVVYSVDDDDATTETAYVLGELYRRDGGWKFRAVGQGYDSGLPGLATDYGFTVEEEEPEAESATAPPPAPAMPEAPPPAPPLPATALPMAAFPAAAAPVPPEPVSPEATAAVATSPALAATPAAPTVPAGIPVSKTGAPLLGTITTRLNNLPTDFGPDFPVFSQEGKGDDIVRVEVPMPAGFAVVDVVRVGESLIEITALNHRNHERSPAVIHSWLEDFSGRGIVDHDGNGPLRLRVKAQGEWKITVSPVSVLRDVSERVEGVGPDVLAYAGPAVDLAIRHRNSRDEAWFQLEAIRRGASRRHLYSGYKSGRGTVALTRGARLLVINCDSPWSITPREVTPHPNRREGEIPPFWKRLR
ncbi:TerD family protein [Streptomyces sp. APSN-46.1]|uniref:TerD family protein n=1 Tax=Streptomyces sp. APSN-46.1 TaxID=2929049 RepID=UPI001FB2A73C|nr:TerD family protein [Streptomyces sp. APSN-46.1]MCJ1676334.1 TerD family protein [Streptomyces sp. APSN-46.1]